MPYRSRLGCALHRPGRAISEVLARPDLFRTTLFMALTGILFGVLIQYTMSTAVVPHFLAVYTLMFNTIWLLPSLLSMLLFWLMGKRFSAEVYLECGYLAFMPFYTGLWAYFLPAGIYHYLRGDCLAYPAIVCYDEWIYLAFPVGLGFLLSYLYSILVGVRVARARWYVSFLVWTLSLSSLYVTYLIFRGWL